MNDCEVALYWDYFWNHVVAAWFDADGVEDLTRDTPEEISYTGLGAYFAEVDLNDWDWVHPRHQWRTE